MTEGLIKHEDIMKTGIEQGWNTALSHRVGRNKPPLWSRWKPGISGNPLGRPPNRVTLETALRRELKNGAHAQKVVNDLVNKAIAGDLEAIKLIWNELDKIPVDGEMLEKLGLRPHRQKS